MGTHTPASRKFFKAGEVIIRQGEVSQCAYIIEKGRVDIVVEHADGRVQQVGTRGPGTIVGEMAIVDDARRVATVRALEDCSMLEISREDFGHRLKASDSVLRMITQVILVRYRDTLMRAETLAPSSPQASSETLERDVAAQTDVIASVTIANEFQEAMRLGQLSLNYQPIVRLADGQVMGFEALMRWTHPQKGAISPGVFIPVAENSGLIVEATLWALREACGALARIDAGVKLAPAPYMSVNFTSDDFASEGFVGSVLEIIRSQQLTPGRVKIEVTERLLIQQPEQAQRTLESCRDEGLGIAIDDFGTGYSSLSYLHRFPINLLKIDQSFVRAMVKEPRSLSLVRSIVGLAQGLGMTSLAEGVEGPEEARILHELGCEFGQGYHFSKPLPEAKLIETLRAWKAKPAS